MAVIISYLICPWSKPKTRKELRIESLEHCRLLCAQDEVQRLKAKAAQVPTFHPTRDLVSGQIFHMFTLTFFYLTDLMSECGWGCC